MHHLHEHKHPACLSGTVAGAVAMGIMVRFWAEQSRHSTSWMWKLGVGNATKFGFDSVPSNTKARSTDINTDVDAFYC